MFTGIIKYFGYSNIFLYNNIIRFIKININFKKFNKIKIGDSISINGICITIQNIKYRKIYFTIIKETFSKIVNFLKIKINNIENSINLYNNKNIDGHLINGHIDFTGTIININKKKYKFIIKIPIKYFKYVIYKSSISVDGVSLTINKILKFKKLFYITLNIIPYTFKNTIFNNYKLYNKINLEFDLISKYII